MNTGVILANGKDNIDLLFIPEISTITGAYIIGLDGTLEEFKFEEPVIGKGLCEYNKETNSLKFVDQHRLAELNRKP